MLCVPGYGRNLGVVLSQKIPEGRRGFGSDFGNARRIFIGDGRKSDKIIGSVGVCAVEFGERRGFCIQRDLSQTFIREKNRPVLFDGRRNVYGRAFHIFSDRKLGLERIFRVGSIF